MNDWLKLMLEEIRRKQREREQASREHQRRGSGRGAPAPTGPRSPGAGRRD